MAKKFKNTNEKQKIKVFGLMEHFFFYLIFVFTVLHIVFKSEMFIYLIIISWLFSMLSHIIESKLEGKETRKIFVGA